MVAFPKRPLFYLCCLFQLKKHRWLNKSSLEDARPYFSMEAKKSKRRERESTALIFSPTKLIYTPRQKSETEGEGESGKRNGTRTIWTSNLLCKVALARRNHNQTASNKINDNLALAKIHKTSEQLPKDGLHERGRD